MQRILLPVMRILFLLLGILGIMVFFIPYTRHISNVGNGVGMAASIFVVICCIWSKKIGSILSAMWQHRSGKPVLICAGSVLCAGILLCAVLSVIMIRGMQNKPKSQPQAVIVLGCKVNGSTPSLMLSRRIRAAYDALQQYPEAVCVVSGGKGSDEHISEAECMQRELLEMGIPSDRILTEDKSTSTAENLQFSYAILKENGITEGITLVTDGFHEARAQYIAKINGLPACTALPTATSWYLLPTYWVREWFGLVHAFVFKC